MKLYRTIAAAVALMLTAGTADASSFRLAPTRLELNGGAASSSVRVWNTERKPVSVQVRVFRWTKVNGKDRLEPTTDVVASPPVSKLAPGRENVIRVVRRTDRPIKGQESYRLLIDELPDVSKVKAGTVNVVIRHSIPVHFSE